jgi:hypothetical protein
MTSAIFFRRKERTMSSKLREALLKADVLISIATFEEGVKMDEVGKISSEIKAAIAEPLRNCDVGTAEEQYVRFRDMCVNTNCEGLVKHNTLSEYAFAWSQMPYEEEK